MSPEVEEYLAELDDLPERICQALRAEAQKQGLGDDLVAACTPDTAVFRLSLDPASGLDTLVGEWRDERKQKKGELTVHADGSFFAEYDVVQPHPSKTKWFVEAVTAWGRADSIRSEPRLLPMPD